jgi:hypothetical protein
VAAWDLGLRLRVGIGKAFCILLGATLLVQGDVRNSGLAERLRFGWTPLMLGWVLLVLGLIGAFAVMANFLSVAAITSFAQGVVFIALGVAVWPHDGESFWFPSFLAFAAANFFATTFIMSRDRGQQ